MSDDKGEKMEKMAAVETYRGRTKSGIAYEFWPGGRGVPVLFAHGMTMNGRIWRDTIAPHIGARPIATLDLPWHGDTVDPVDPDIAYASRGVHDVCDALGWPRCLAVGHSYAVGVLLLAALQNPRRFAAQLHIGPHGDFDDHWRQRYDGFLSLVQDQGPISEDVIKLAVELWYTPPFRVAHADVVAGLVADFLRHVQAPRLRQSLLAFQALPHLEDRLRALDLPVHAAVMADDLGAPPSWAEVWLQALRAKVHRLPGGHMLMHEQPEVLQGLLEELFGEHGA